VGTNADPAGAVQALSNRRNPTVGGGRLSEPCSLAGVKWGWAVITIIDTVHDAAVSALALARAVVRLQAAICAIRRYGIALARRAGITIDTLSQGIRRLPRLWPRGRILNERNRKAIPFSHLKTIPRMIVIPRMKQTFIHVSRFVAKWRSLKLNDADLSALESWLMADPDTGDVIAGTGGVRKVRFAPPSRHTGKSGAFRVAYTYFRSGDTVYLLTIFGKNEQDNVTAEQKTEFKALMKVLAEYHKPK
jgi:hypothetical protein